MAADETCPQSKDGHGHCRHWCDNEGPCCWCGDDTPDPDADPREEADHG